MPRGCVIKMIPAFDRLLLLEELKPKNSLRAYGAEEAKGLKGRKRRNGERGERCLCLQRT